MNEMKPWSDEELREKVGQLFIVGFHGHTASSDIITLIQTHKIGSIILFQRNISSGPQLLELTNTLRTLAADSNHKQGLFIAIDQENGLVTRIKSPIAAQLPGAMALGATGDAENAYKVAAATAETLKSFGINMNYAPVADVNSEPKNPVIGVRSLSDDPEAVGRFVSAQVKGLSQGGVVPCVKHFPGHGDTAIDSHHGLPVISKSREELDKCELIPFRRAVVEGIDSVMTAHIALPELGSDNVPASLNPDAIKILREEMKYDGLIVSDCLEMDGVRATFGTERGAVLALKAGTDCVMVCHTMTAQVGAIEEVIRAVKSGEIPQEAIQASVARVEALKEKYSIDTNTIDESILEGACGRKSSLADLASQIYTKSTTLVRSEEGALPISSVLSKKIVFIGPGKAPAGGGAVESGEEKTREPYVHDSFIDLLLIQNPNVVNIRFHDGSKPSNEDEKAIDEAATVILATRNASLSPYQKDYGLSLGKRLGNKLIVVATCDPYDFLEEKEEIKNYITIYEPTIPAFKSAVDVIFGLISPQGKLPVGSPAPKHVIHHLTTSDSDILQLHILWKDIFPSWPITQPRLTKVLSQPHGHHFLHRNGFILSFLMTAPNGALHAKIAAIGVLATSRNCGLATALLNTAKLALHSAAGDRKLSSLQIGSVFPRLWPQVPTTFPQGDKDFFLHRGFRHPSAPTARDMYKSITHQIAPPETMQRVSETIKQHKLRFAPWTAEGYEECMLKQKRQFKNIGWVEAFDRLASAGQHHEVMVAFSVDSGEQIGWTVMSSLHSVVADDFAFLPLMPSASKTGLVGCVGVDESWRGKGVGLALLVRAMEDMKARGIEGVGIDWVVIRGFYERLGFEALWEYEGYEW